MKKAWVLITNILIIAGIILAVTLYTRAEQRAVYQSQVQAFQSMTATMEQVTGNYLESEQNICDIWAHFIDTHPMSMAEAIDYIEANHVLAFTSGHIIFLDDGTYSGLSTTPNAVTGSIEVSYEKVLTFPDPGRIAPIGNGTKVTRAYTNPMDGVQSIAFYNKVTLQEADGSLRPALVLRVVPVASLEAKWVFPQESYRDVEFSVVDGEGNYIIRGRSFKNTNFVEFVKSYNTMDAAATEALIRELSAETGSFTIFNSKRQEILVAHTPILSSEGWILLGAIPTENLSGARVDWRLVGIVAAGLLLLLLFDLIFMRQVNRTLQRSAHEAEVANLAKTQFLSTMSHDIRTPMNAIVGLTTIAEKTLDDPASTKEHLRKISMASNHLLTLINDILDISKVESGKLNLSPVTFSIVETVENLVNMSQPMVKEKNIDFRFRVNRMEKEYLYADQLRLNQICINLLSNAVKYTQPGGSVSVDLRESPSDKPGCVHLTYTVADTGMGMSKEFMARMYEPFSRQTDSRVNTIQGTGLGLAITKQMVDLMGGTIACESEEGKGTVFQVDLDIPEASRQLDEMRLEPIDVLVVDDDPVLLETAFDNLTSLGARPETASSGEEGLGLIVSRHRAGRDFDIVIIDWKMPEMDGVSCVKRIREEVGNRVPIVLISAYDFSEVEEAAKEAGVNGFISKPLFRSRLYETLSATLGMQSKPVEPEEDHTDLADMRILIAEDNDVNWEIISMLLSMYGVMTERAENGQVCVEMLQEAPEGAYNLVFMDIQMPVMNGLDATRAIRGLKDCWASRIPIIAMTADAFSENVAECLAAGMNGHIAKPVDIKLVIKEITRIKEESGR